MRHQLRANQVDDVTGLSLSLPGTHTAQENKASLVPLPLHLCPDPRPYYTHLRLCNNSIRVHLSPTRPSISAAFHLSRLGPEHGYLFINGVKVKQDEDIVLECGCNGCRLAAVSTCSRIQRILSNHEIFGLAATVFWHHISVESPHLSFSSAFRSFADNFLQSILGFERKNFYYIQTTP